MQIREDTGTRLAGGYRNTPGERMVPGEIHILIYTVFISYGVKACTFLDGEDIFIYVIGLLYWFLFLKVPLRRSIQRHELKNVRAGVGDLRS